MREPLLTVTGPGQTWHTSPAQAQRDRGRSTIPSAAGARDIRSRAVRVVARVGGRACAVLASRRPARAADAAAAAAMRVVDVPGVSGRSVTIAAAGRLADGGAIVAGTLTPRGRGGAAADRRRAPAPRRAHRHVVRRRRASSPCSSRAATGAPARARRRSRSIPRAGARGSAPRSAATTRARCSRSTARGRRVQALRLGRGRALRRRRDGAGRDRLRRRAARGRGDAAAVPRLSGAAARPGLGRAPRRRSRSRRCPAATRALPAGAARQPRARRRRTGSCSAGRAAARAPIGALRACRDGGAWRAGRRELARGSGAWRGRRIASRSARCVAARGRAAGPLRGRRARRRGRGSCASPPARRARRRRRSPRAAWTPVAGTLAGVVPLGDRALRRAAAARGPAGARAAGVERRRQPVGRPRCPRGLRAGAIFRCKRHVLVVGTRRSGRRRPRVGRGHGDHRAAETPERRSGGPGDTARARDGCVA